MTVTQQAPEGTLSLAQRAILCRTIAPVTGKGGILKTATATCIAVSAARLGMKVLFVDMDGHGVGSQRDMGQKETEHNDQGQSLADALTMTFMGRPTAPNVLQGVVTYPQANGTVGQVDVVVGGAYIDSAIDVISALALTQKREYRHVLGQVLSLIAPGYHLVILDNNPTNKAVRLMILEATAFSYAPIDYDIAAYVDGLEQLAREIGEARERNPEHIFLGAVAARMPTSSIYAWRGTDKDGNARQRKGRPVEPGGAMVDIVNQMRPILATPVFDPERALLGPEYPKIFEAMVRMVPLQAANARKAGVTLVQHALEMVSDPGDAAKVVTDYAQLTNELLIEVTRVQQAREAVSVL